MYDPKDNPNYLPPNPYAKGVWKGREIEAFKSEAYGCVVFYSRTDEEVEVNVDEISSLMDSLQDIRDDGE